MHRTALNLTLVFALLAQGMPLHHGHSEGGQPVDHDARPHFHFHGHDGHHHEAAHYHDVEERPAPSPDGWQPGHKHDDTAVYVQVTPAVPSDAKGLSADTLSLSAVNCVSSGHFSAVHLPPPEAVAEPPPGAFPAGLPIYLRTLSLRI